MKRFVLLYLLIEILHIVSVCLVDRLAYTFILLVTFCINGCYKSLDCSVDICHTLLTPRLLSYKCRNRDGKFFLYGIHRFLNWSLDVEKRNGQLLLVDCGKYCIFLHFVKSNFRLTFRLKYHLVFVLASPFLFLWKFIIGETSCQAILMTYLVVI